jgi:hypothetical protein
MSMFDDDYGAEMEAIEAERLDADIEQAQMTAVGNAIYRAEQRGICTHGSVTGYINPPVYPEQAGLKPGQMICTKGTAGCARVFNSDEEWYAAMDEAIR